MQQPHANGARAEARKFGLARLRIAEIALAILLTLAALLFVIYASWG